MAVLILMIMVIYVTMVYGPIAAFLVEMFPTKIRYTSMSLPYHIGNGWFGGMLPLLATAFVAAYGDIYVGLWYPIVVAIMTVVDRRPVPARDQGRRHHDRLCRRRSKGGRCCELIGRLISPDPLEPRARAGLFFCGVHLFVTRSVRPRESGNPAYSKCISLARTKPLSSPRRRGPITTKISVIASPATSLRCGVWVPAFAGTTSES